MATGPEPTDAELVAALRGGAAGAFDGIYRRYRVRIYGFLVRLAGRRDVADDLFQETFMQLARHATRLRPDTDLAAFLYTVARNRYRNHRRLSLFRLGRLREIMTGRDRPGGDSPFDEVAARGAAQHLEQALQGLSPSLREVVLLVAVEGLDAESAARILGIEPAAVRQRLSRARGQLLGALGPHLDSDGDPGKKGGRHGRPGA